MIINRANATVSSLLLIINSMMLTPALAASDVTLPRGTLVKLILKTNLDSSVNKVGDPFTAELAEDISIEGHEAIRRGAIVDGEISRIETPKRLAGLQGKASMILRFDRIHTASGDEPLTASLVSIHDPSDKKQEEVVKGEGQIERKRDAKGTLEKGALGVGGGTVLGAIFGSVSKGLILGSIGGAVAILGAKGKDVTLSEGTGLVIRLDRELATSTD